MCRSQVRGEPAVHCLRASRNATARRLALRILIQLGNPMVTGLPQSSDTNLRRKNGDVVDEQPTESRRAGTRLVHREVELPRFRRAIVQALQCHLVSRQVVCRRDGRILTHRR
jgi:hypothetical protein